MNEQGATTCAIAKLMLSTMTGTDAPSILVAQWLIAVPRLHADEQRHAVYNDLC